MSEDLDRRDLEVILGYAADHPDQWVGVRRTLDQHSWVASFTADADAHRGRLAPLVSDASRLIVDELPYSARYLETVLDEINAEFMRATPPVAYATGMRHGVIDVHLHATEERIAEQLMSRYGAAVEIRVGALTYPLESNPPRSLHDITTSRSPLPGIELTVELPTRSIRSGDDTVCQLMLRNITSTAITVDTGQPAVGGITYPDSHQLVGWYVGAVMGTGLRPTIPPGDATHILALLGTAGTTPHVGYCPAPGPYDAYLVLDTNGTGGRSGALSKPVRVTLT